MKKSENLEVPLSKYAATNDLKGLYVFNEFITKEEEEELVQKIDQN